MLVYDSWSCVLPLQSAWRGYDLRRRLACALAGARFTESDEDFEEVDTDEFIFDEV